MIITLDLGLNDADKFHIGEIISQWAAIEQEIFNQTLSSFGDDIAIDQLPKAMRNLNFSEVLKLWMERVLPKAHRKAAPVLAIIPERMDALIEFRNAIAHGMFSWEPSDPVKLISSRIKKDQLVRVIFTSSDLAVFSKKVSAILFDVKYPRGETQFYFEKAKEGGSMSRRFLEMLNGKT